MSQLNYKTIRRKTSVKLHDSGFRKWFPAFDTKSTIKKPNLLKLLVVSIGSVVKSPFHS